MATQFPLKERQTMKTLIVFGATLLLLGSTSPRLVARAATEAPGFEATQGRATAPGQEKKYRGTRAIVSDGQTGHWRLPNETEVAEMVTNLTTLTNRSNENLQLVPLQANAVGIDLQGRFAGVVLARPNDDGTLETRCVFTFEEAAEFLGLVEIAQ
jgi:hypothetical protein